MKNGYYHIELCAPIDFMEVDCGVLHIFTEASIARFPQEAFTKTMVGSRFVSKEGWT